MTPPTRSAAAPIAPGNAQTFFLPPGGEILQPQGLGPGDRPRLTFMIDVHPECTGIHPLIRYSDERGAVSIALHQASANSVLEVVGMRCEDSFVGQLRLSGSYGMRLAIRLDLDRHQVQVNELHPWRINTDSISLDLSPGGALDGVMDDMRVGGSSSLHEGESFRGRIGNFAVFLDCLDDTDLRELVDVSQPDHPRDIPRFSPGALDDDGRELLLDDYRRLVQWHEQGALTDQDVRDASVLAYRWLLDTYPLLRRASDHFGTMLLFADLLEYREFLARAMGLGPAWLWPGHATTGDWLPMSTFLDDMACWLGQAGRKVTWPAFLSFIRNKMGGGHFDPDDRKKWQAELNDLTRAVQVSGKPWLNELMLVLVRSLIMVADGCGLIAMATDQPYESSTEA